MYVKVMFTLPAVDLLQNVSKTSVHLFADNIVLRWIELDEKVYMVFALMSLSYLQKTDTDSFVKKKWKM